MGDGEALKGNREDEAVLNSDNESLKGDGKM